MRLFAPSIGLQPFNTLCFPLGCRIECPAPTSSTHQTDHPDLDALQSARWITQRELLLQHYDTPTARAYRDVYTKPARRPEESHALPSTCILRSVSANIQIYLPVIQVLTAHAVWGSASVSAGRCLACDILERDHFPAKFAPPTLSPGIGRHRTLTSRPNRATPTPFRTAAHVGFAAGHRHRLSRRPAR